MLDLTALRAAAIRASLFAPTTLADAVQTLGFVQYDPIRRPARAQDLILHQRVLDYHCGDLDREYARLNLDEDYFYTYGAMPRELMFLLHPRPSRKQPGRRYHPTGLPSKVLDIVRENESVHPRDLVARFGRIQAVNDWGGTSAATTRALEELHYHGLIRIARRDNGIKIYEATASPEHELTPRERIQRLALRIVRILGPISETSLGATLLQLRNRSGGLPARRTLVAELVKSGELERAVVDGVSYVWMADTPMISTADPEPQVRFLAPFDPVVWDRRRFTHFWGWAYRLEAYTPATKRQFGYYALPMLYRDQAIGWVNFDIKHTSLVAERNFVDREVTDRVFRHAFDGEIARLQRMVAGLTASDLVDHPIG